MKIGIMSMQRVKNYGSFLQAYGLKKVIESLDGSNVVEFVDCETKSSLIENSGTKKSIVKRVINMLSPQYRKYRAEQIKMGSTFDEFCNAYDKQYLPLLDINQDMKYKTQLDTLVIGSDEVFNCTQKGNLVGYSLQLFGKENNANRVISYAASFGSTTFEKLEKYGKTNEIAECLNDFDAISVRDDNSKKLIGKLINKVSSKNIDPVLLYDFPEMDDIKIDLKDYIVVYAYADRISQQEAEVIKSFAQEKGKKILTLGFWQTFCDEYVLATPFEVLAYIKNADYVITDTFHGTVFSIKYGTPFATIIRESNKQKLSDLLETFNLSNRKIDDLSKIKEVLETPVDKQKIFETIKQEQQKSIEYLRKNL